MKFIHYFIVILIIIFSFLLSSLYSSNFSFNSPDEMVNKLMSEQFIKNGQLEISEPPIKEKPYLTPRGFFFYNEKIVPLKFIGFPIVVGSLSAFNPQVMQYVTPLSSIILLIFAFLISRLIFQEKKYQIICLAILSLLPYFVYWASHSFFENILGVSFFITGVFYILKSKGNPNAAANYLLASLFFSISLGIRHDLAIPFVAMLVVLLIDYKSLNFKVVLLSIIVFLIGILPFLYSNYSLYGSPFDYGQKISSSISEAKPERSIKNILLNLENIFVLFPISLFYILGLFSYRKWNKIRGTLIILIILTLFLYSYIYISEFPPKNEDYLHSSFVRYMLPMLILISIFSVSFLSKLSSKKLIAFCLTIFIIYSILSFIPLVKKEWDRRENNQLTADKIYSVVAEDALILANTDEKYLYPERKVFSLNYYRNNNGEIDIIASINEIDSLIREGYIIYYYSWSEDGNKLRQRLFSNGSLEITDVPGLYKIVKDENST